MAIRSNTDPKNTASSSGAHRGELDQYGVWVKAEPRDIAETTEASLPDEKDFAPDLPSETQSEESFLSEDEEKLLGSFDAEFESLGSEVERISLPDIDEIPPLDEPPLEASGVKTGAADEIEDMDSSTVDISLEDLEGGGEGSGISPYAEVDIESVQGLESPTELASPSALAMEDVSAEFLDNLEEAPAAESSFDSHDVTAEFLDIAQPTREEKPEEPTPDFEPLDMDLTFDDTLPSEGKASEGRTDGFENVTEFDDFLSEEEAEAAGPAASAPPPADFDDLSAVERELSSPAPEQRIRTKRVGLDSSSEILLKIADELSSIRGELISLKEQLKGFRHEGRRAEEKAPPSEEAAPSGFFDEEEDETIALTGDELDNILNTADFTEEVAEPTAEGEFDAPLAEKSEAAGVALPQDISIINETILPENGEYGAAPSEPAIEELNIGETVAAVHPPADKGAMSAPEFEEISLMAEEGVRPMTEAPEDTSYLESALSAETAEFDETIPTDVPLVEPDLSDFDLEAEELEAEPRLEIDEELPVVELPEESIKELTLGVEAPSSYAEEKPFDLETLEVLPEFEESELQEVNLHHEALQDEAEESAEIEELLGVEDDSLAAEIEAKTVKPSQPISQHPDTLPSSLDESFFIGEEAEAIPETENEPVREIEEKPAVELGGEVSQAAAPILEELPVEIDEELLPVSEKEKGFGEATAAPEGRTAASSGDEKLKSEIRNVLAYLDKLLDSLPEDKIEEFARSQYFDTYKRLFEELGLV